MIRTIASSTIISILCLPFFASAVTPEELRAQINMLLQRIESLQGQANTVPGQQSVVPTQTRTNVTCPHISRSLKIGSTGDDVARLQRFLALDPSLYPEGQVTGYYGQLTAAAIKRFQCKNKLVCEGTGESTGYGVTGPRTAALLALQCPDILGSGDSNTGGFIKVTPITGAAPHAVVVEATINTTRSCSAATYEVDFGDGSGPIPLGVPNGACAEIRQVLNHTYTRAGTYLVTLRSGVHRTTATVVVTGDGGGTGGNDTFSANATSGAAPFSVTFSGIINAAGSCNAGPYRMDFGDGETAQLPLSGCAPSSYTVTHAYQNGGNFTALLIRGTPGQSVGSISIAATGDTGSGYGSYFAVSPTVGGDDTSVTAQFEIRTPCTGYDLDWGDGSAHQTQSHGTCGGGVASKEFEHTYANIGTYTLTLRRGAGLSEMDSATITISE